MKTRLLSVCVAAVVAMMAAVNVSAEIASGTCGTCDWAISDDSTLTISPTDGKSGVLDPITLVSMNTPNTPWHSYRLKVKTVRVEGDVATSESANGMFFNFKNCTNMVLKDLDMSNDTALIYTFYGCQSLEALDIENWNTSKVVDMTGTFVNCNKLQSLDLSNWNVSNVREMGFMFQNCKALETLKADTWNTSNVTEMDYIFSSCEVLNSLDFAKNWDVSKVENMEYAFVRCKAIPSVEPLRNWNVGKASKMSGVFKQCEAVASFEPIQNWNTDSATDMKALFYGCKSVEELDLSKWNVSNVTDMSFMFRECFGLKTLDVSNWNTKNVMKLNSAFYNCTALETIKGIDQWNTESLLTLASTFYSCKKLESLDLGNWVTNNLVLLESAFVLCTNLKSVGQIGRWNTESVTSLASTFLGCASLTELDLSGWNTSLVKSVNSTFSSCKKLKSLNLSGWDLSNVTKANYTFSYVKVMGADLDVLTTIAKNDGTIEIELPYTMYDWDNNNAEYTTMPVGELKLHKDKALTVSEIRDTVDATTCGVLGSLIVAMATDVDKMLWCTDGEGNWIRAQVDEAMFEKYAEANKISNVGGTLSSMATNPLLTIGTTPTVVDGEAFTNYRSFTMIDNFSDVQGDEVAYFTGVYDEVDGKPMLRDAAKNQYLALDFKYVENVDLTVGNQYVMLCAMLINEAWEAEAENGPQQIKKSDANYYTNYVGYPLIVVEDASGVSEQTLGSEVTVEKYVNPAGMESDTPFSGVNIVRMSDGSVKKIMK